MQQNVISKQQFDKIKNKNTTELSSFLYNQRNNIFIGINSYDVTILPELYKTKLVQKINNVKTDYTAHNIELSVDLVCKSNNQDYIINLINQTIVLPIDTNIKEPILDNSYVDPSISFELNDLGQQQSPHKIGVWDSSLNPTKQEGVDVYLDKTSHFLPDDDKLSARLPSTITENDIKKYLYKLDSRAEHPKIEILDYNDWGTGTISSVIIRDDGSVKLEPNDKGVLSPDKLPTPSSFIQFKLSWSKWGPEKKQHSITAKFYSTAEIKLHSKYSKKSNVSIIPDDIKQELKAQNITNKSFWMYDNVKGEFSLNKELTMKYLLEFKVLIKPSLSGQNFDSLEKEFDLNKLYPNWEFDDESSVVNMIPGSLYIQWITVRNLGTKNKIHRVKHGTSDWKITFNNLPK